MVAYRQTPTGSFEKKCYKVFLRRTHEALGGPCLRSLRRVQWAKVSPLRSSLRRLIWISHEPSPRQHSPRQKLACSPIFKLRPGKGAFGKAVLVNTEVAL